LTATKTYPGATLSEASTFTPTVGGLRSERERKLCVDPDCPEEDIVDIQSAGRQPSVFRRTAPAAPAPATLRNSRRVCLVPKLFLL
jgi:hypothetical protein